MEYFKIIIRMSFFYFFILIIYRLMGKREVGQLGIIDLIVSILIAELVAISVEDSTKSILSSIIPIVTLVFFEILLSFLSLKSKSIRTILDGNPTFIIKNGRINYREMIKQKYSLDDLLVQLREKGYSSIESIEYALLENNGTLSIFPYSKLNIKSPIPMPIILDGKLQTDTIKEMGESKNLITHLLDKKHLQPQDIFYAFYKNNRLFIIKYTDLD